MSRAIAALIGLAALIFAACSQDDPDPSQPGAGNACLARPGQLPRPPVGTLPCELIPPGLSLK